MSTPLTCPQFILYFCRALGWTQPDLSFRTQCTALPSLHNPIHTPSPPSCLTQSSGQWGRYREGARAVAGWWFGDGCLYIRKKGPLWQGIRMDNLLGHLLTPSEQVKFFFGCPFGMHQVYRGVCLEFYLTCINLVEEGQVEQLRLTVHYGIHFSSAAASSILRNVWIPLSPCFEARLVLFWFVPLNMCVLYFGGDLCNFINLKTAINIRRPHMAVFVSVWYFLRCVAASDC